MINVSREWKGNREEDLKEGNYFIIDWVANNPMNPRIGMPRIIVANATEEDLKRISTNELTIPNPVAGTIYRITAKIEKINKV